MGDTAAVNVDDAAERNSQMKNCRMCSGNGIITLIANIGGTPMRAPCLECSPDKKLSDLERAEYEKEMGYALALEKKQIEAHNERIAGL